MDDIGLRKILMALAKEQSHSLCNSKTILFTVQLVFKNFVFFKSDTIKFLRFENFINLKFKFFHLIKFLIFIIIYYGKKKYD